MFKKTRLTGLLLAALFYGIAACAQNGDTYTTGLGIHGDLSTDNLYGFSVKHFLSEQLAGQVTLLFGSGVTVSPGGELQYHVPIASAPGLQWYIGGGVQALFFKYSGTSVWVRPIGGLDYKVNTAPVALSLDWRPTFILNQGGGTNIGRFGLGVRFTL